jgi:hypothetical protein
MNDLDLDLALGAMGARRTRVSVPPSLRERIHAVPLRATGIRIQPHITRRSFDMSSATKFVLGGVIAALIGGVLLSATVTSPSPPTPNVVPSASAAPSSSPAPAVHWKTQVVDLAADAFAVAANGLDFTTAGAEPEVHSDPGSADYWTLELIWTEHDREQRLFMYFGSDGTDWWVDEIRTYDGYEEGEWIYAYGPFFKTPLGETYEGDVRIDLLGRGRPGDPDTNVPGVLTIEGMRLRGPEDVAALPPDGGVAVDRDPFGKGGPLKGSGILRLPPAQALERLLEEGYRVAFRLYPDPGDDFDPTIPPQGVIQRADVDPYGNILLFVVAGQASSGPSPTP